jgi:diguanylate cyclase (GGDEF)-like protein
LAEETDSDRLRGILASNALTINVVSALAGDRSLTDSESQFLVELKKRRGQRFYSDLLYSIAHQYYSPEIAEPLWFEILEHKFHLSSALGRNVGMTVAMLDYVANITHNMSSAMLIDEKDIIQIVGMSLRDGLTGLFNHTYFYQQIDLEVKRFVRYGTPVSLLIIDIDDFKEVNDTFGHPEGDRIIASMGHTLGLLARGSDICCRYGGEEFAIILPLTEFHEVTAYADRLRTAVAERLPNGRTVTVSIGAASCGKLTNTYRDLVEKADLALYHVKRNGKNRVLLMDEESTELTDKVSEPIV